MYKSFKMSYTALPYEILCKIYLELSDSHRVKWIIINKLHYGVFRNMGFRSIVITPKNKKDVIASIHGGLNISHTEIALRMCSIDHSIVSALTNADRIVLEWLKKSSDKIIRVKFTYHDFEKIYRDHLKYMNEDK